MSATHTHTQGLGEQESIWFKLTALHKGGNPNPMQTLCQLTERHGGVITVNMGNERVVFLSEPEHFKRVLVGKVDNYIKYFDGLKPIFGKSMITHDGALWQKIRMPQQPAFHPDMFAEYIPYFLAAIQQKMEMWGELAKTGETVEMVEQTWTLAADMICKALFDRDMPFNPHVIFKYVKTYTDVMNHKDLRLKKVSGAEFEITEEIDGEGDGSLGQCAASGDGRRSARAAEPDPAEADRGRGRQSGNSGFRRAAGGGRAQAVFMGRD